MMFCSMDGHASFHTAGSNGPSTMARSNSLGDGGGIEAPSLYIERPAVHVERVRAARRQMGSRRGRSGKTELGGPDVGGGVVAGDRTRSARLL
jgi:hypothetical protein